MNDLTKESRVKRLNQVQEERKEQTFKKVEATLEKMQKAGMKINFSTVAQEANVSESYLYKYPEIKHKIAHIRNQQASMPAPRQPESTSKQSHLKIVDRLKQRIKDLEDEVTKYRRINEGLAGKVYRVSELEELVKRQDHRIRELEERIQKSFLNENSSKVTDIRSKNTSSGLSQKILSQLDILNIKLNSTLKKSIVVKSEEKVLEAIEALKQALETNEISNLAGWLKTAIDEEWKTNETLLKEEIKESIFDQTNDEINENNVEDLVSLDQLKALSNIFNYDK